MKDLLIDIGGTKTNLYLVEEIDSTSFNIIKKNNILTPSNPDHLIQKIEELSNEAVERISLSLPGKWTKAGELEESINLKNWIGYPFINNIKERLHIKNVKWESDVICGGLGEFAQLKEKDKTLLYINIGTGIGGSLIINGSPFKQKNKLILRLHKLLSVQENEIYSSVDLLNGKELGKEIFQAYRDGDIEAIDLISKAQTQLAVLLINLNSLFSPDVMVLNGGLTYDFEILCQEAIDIANEDLNNSVEIIPSTLKDLAPIYGAYFNSHS